jgi:putative hydrolase of the HAD superfamily
MIKAIIFDCFGVLVRDSLGPFYAKHMRGDTEKIRIADIEVEKSNEGIISYGEFVNRLSEISGIDDGVVRYELSINPRNEQLLELISEKLHGQYKIGLLSNASENWISELFTSQNIELFDDIVLSYEVQIIKPDVKIFQLASKRLGVDTDECIFVDDLEKYLIGAREAGMKTILFKDTEQFIVELEAKLRERGSDN